MSVLSILIQLHAFLADRRLHYADGLGSVERAKQLIATHRCAAAGCSHLGLTAPWPPLDHHVGGAKPSKRIICRPCGAVALVNLKDDEDVCTAEELAREFPVQVKDKERKKGRSALRGVSHVNCLRASTHAVTSLVSP